MGAAASIEMQKPLDASDVSHTLETSKNEVIRLRELLGQYARQAGFNEVVYDASDIAPGIDHHEEHERCVEEVIYIRRALRLSTQKATRSRRALMTNIEEKQREEKHEDDEVWQNDGRSSSGSDTD